MSEEKYRHLYVVIEIENGKPIPVSLEMLGEARRLMDDFNKKYSSNEKVVAVLLGDKVKELAKTLIQYGADAVIVAESPELKDVRNTIFTKVISQIALDSKLADQIAEEYAGQIKKPRYMFFAADSIGRHLSSTVLVELDSGHNTNEKFKRDYHPQSCSLIPGVFEPLEPDTKREGKIIEYIPQFDEKDLRIKILNRQIVKSEVDFDVYKAIVSFGRGIKDDPEKNIKLIEGLAKQLDAEIGVTLPISKKPFSVSQSLESKYFIPDRVIGTSGSKTSPLLYVAAGVSGAMQHVWGMKESGFVVAINPDEEAPIKDECDIFIKGRMEDVIPLLVEELKKQKMVAQA
jgi:electron transfer flavoprotein alpha subunit